MGSLGGQLHPRLALEVLAVPRQSRGHSCDKIRKKVSGLLSARRLHKLHWRYEYG